MESRRRQSITAALVTAHEAQKFNKHKTRKQKFCIFLCVRVGQHLIRERMAEIHLQLNVILLFSFRIASSIPTKKFTFFLVRFYPAWISPQQTTTFLSCFLAQCLFTWAINLHGNALFLALHIQPLFLFQILYRRRNEVKSVSSSSSFVVVQRQNG